MRAVIGVGIASYPISSAGNTWNSLNWALGFRDLGWDVWIAENLPRAKCIDSQWRRTEPDRCVNVRRWRDIVRQFGFENRETLLIDDETGDLEPFRHFCSEADLFLNLSGHFRTRHSDFPKAVRIYQDGDPAFTQIWAEQYGCDMHFSGHDRFITAGLRLGQSGTLAPTCGIEWLPTFPPVVLEHWPVAKRPEVDSFTSVIHLGGYSGCEWQGNWYHGKREEFARYIDFPRSVRYPVEIATQSAAHASELEVFRQSGWRFREAAEVCGDLGAYSRYIGVSSAELGIAKGGYVTSRAAWFSDRSVCYAASGKPLVLEDTGVGDLLPEGKGYFAFSTARQAAEACENVMDDYENQSRQARLLAEEFFDSRKVIPRLLSKL